MDAFTLVAKLTLDSSTFEAKFKEVEGTMNSPETTGKFTAWGQTVGNLAAEAIKASVGAAIEFVKSSVETGINFDAQMSKVYAIMQGQGNLTQEQMDALRDTAMEMGRTTKFTAEEAAEALAYMAQAGWSTDEAISGLPGLLQLAASGGTDLGETASIVTNALNAFGLKATDAGHFADLLAVAASSADTNVALMGETFKYVAANAGTMNISAEDIAHSIGLIANSGIKGSQAGTALSRILTRIATDAGASKDTLGALGIITEQLGVEVYDSEHHFRDWGDILTETRKKWQGLTDDQEKMNFAKQIAGQYGLAAWNALMNASVEDVNELQSQIDNAEGRAALMSDTMLDNLKGDLTLMNSAIDGLKIMVSDSFTGQLRTFVSTFTEEVGKMGEAFDEGGLSGMFLNLTDWIIGGITDTLSNPEITVEGANDFGEALGQFVGNLVAKLVTSAPTVIKGLYEAGMNLAGGLVEGLFAGLFGTGDNTVYGFMQNAEDERNDLITDANKTAAEAQGIVSYMQSLVSEYGEAASQSGEWADALDRLEQLIPGITGKIKEEGQALDNTTKSMSDYIEQHRQQAIAEAAQKYTENLQKKYEEAQVQLGQSQVNMEVAKYQQNEAVRQMIELYTSTRSRFNTEKGGRWENYYNDLFSGMTTEEIVADIANDEHGIEDLQDAIKHYADELNASNVAAAAEGVLKAYETAQKEYEDNANQIGTLTNAASELQGQLSVASAAAQRMAEQMASFTVPSFGGGEDGNHAIGSPYIPYDNYHAILHRGETVLTATQARMLRAGGGGSASSAEIAAAVRSAVLDLTMELNGQTVGRVFGDATTRRVSNNMSQMTRRHQYGYGG